MIPLLLVAQLVLYPGEAGTVTCVDGLLTGTVEAPACEPLPAPPPSGSGIYVGHAEVELFDQIPPVYLAAAANLRVLFRGASVGQNILSGLNCLVDNASNFCRRGPDGLSTQPVHYRPEYLAPNWDIEYRGNPGWWGKITDLVAQAPRAGGYDWFTYKQSYVDMGGVATAAPALDGTCVGSPSVCDVAALEAQVGVFYITGAIASIVNPDLDAFNADLRAWTASTGRPLFDLADIAAHDSAGASCGTTICDEWNSELNGGHLTNGLAQQHVAKGWWVFLARLAGWEP